MGTPLSQNRRIEWSDEYSVQVKEIDEQHKHFIEILNRLIAVINTTPREDEVVAVTEEILEYIKFHFSTEEKYFDAFEYEESESHKKEHHDFGVHVKEICDAHKNDPIARAFALAELLEDWFIEHILHTDKKYTACLHEHGVY